MTTSETERAAAAKAAGSNLGARLVAVVLLGVVVYGAIVVVRGADKISAELKTFAWWTFAAACGLSFANYLLRFLKWEYYLGVLGLRRDGEGRRLMSVSESFLVFLSGFVLTVTPGKVGEMFKSLVLFELKGIEVERTAPIVVAERVTDLVGVIVLITVGGASFPGGLFWGGIGAAFVGLLLAIVAVPRFSALLLAPMRRLPGRAGRVAERFLPKVDRALGQLRQLTAPRHLVAPSLFSIAGWALEGIGVFLVLRGFGSSLDPFRATFFYATATLAGALVPVPGGLGVTEKVLEESMVAIGGVPGSVSTATMILSRLATLWFAVLVGFIALGALRFRYPTLLSRKAPAEERA
ncbi:MAG: flippase-like domain-containing protein [Polyangiaceae bacterium]|nr:flippase-like domain-containing protein [Polyangiaceae bacterium]